MEIREIALRRGDTLWIGGVPERIATYPSVETLRFVREGVERNIGEERSVAFRYTRQWGGRGEFLELAAVFSPDGSDRLESVIAVPEEGKSIDKQLAEEFATTIHDTTLEELADAGLLEGGLLRFDRASWHLVDTGQKGIRYVTRRLIHALDRRCYYASDAEIVKSLSQIE